MILSLLIVALALLGIALANVLGWPAVRQATTVRPGSVSVLIPARNEEGHLPACLDAVLQQGESVREILVYDDHSSDGTGAVVEFYRQRDPRVRLVPARPLEPGWTGKNFACAQLAATAQSEFFLFIDADARLRDRAVDSLVEEMRRRNLQFLSCWPGLEMVTFWEQALMPMLNFVVFSIFPGPMSLFMSHSSLALAHGACLMTDGQSYREIGGHSVVREEIFEDTRLAQLWRARGRRGLCLDGQHVVRVRMYSSFGEIWRGFQKNFFPAFKSETSFWVFMSFHALVFLAPFPWLGVANDWRLWLCAGAILSTRFLLAARFHHPLWAILLHPLSQAILLGLGISSWWRCKMGHGVAWKGREYHKKAAASQRD